MLLATLLHPVTSNGFIDEAELFKLVVGTLKLCSIHDYEEFMEVAQPFQIGLLLDNYKDLKKEQYELVSYAFRVGYVSAKKGKHIPLFENEKAKKVTAVTKEDKDNEFAKLEEIFGGGL